MKNVEIYNNNILMVKNYCMYRMLCKENQFQTQENIMFIILTNCPFHNMDFYSIKHIQYIQHITLKMNIEQLVYIKKKHSSQQIYPESK